MIGGFMPDLSKRACREIARRFPRLPVDRIASEFGWYVVERDAQHQPSAEARRTWQALGRRVNALYLAVQPQALPKDPPRGTYDRASINVLRAALLPAAEAFGTAAAKIRRGRGLDLKQGLVLRLADILESAGEAVDAKPTGTLCRLLDIVLRDAGEKPSDVRKIVEAALEKASKQNPEFSKKG